MDFDELVALGVYVHEGDGEYSVDMQKAKEHAPEIWIAELDALDTAILEAVEAGFIELDFTISPEGNLETTYKVLDRGLEAVR